MSRARASDASFGVGTKLKLTFAFNKHDSFGIDLVAMSANDFWYMGRTPCFLDYLATGQLFDVEIVQTVVGGIDEEFRQAGCALFGGEAA
ncbi:MAG: hypothetical protein LBS77_03370 [Desulfovibrio sp.]|jgi:phosphoribosylformylglycinamidine cyclo-ligase|nr:hypothetical protein [Desulfovibrio sp.]